MNGLEIGDNKIKIEEYPTIVQKYGDRGTNNYSKNNISYTIPSNAMSDRGQLLIERNLRIRKLTPKECWRLMGFDDEDFKKAERVNSNTQLYKQARKLDRGECIRKNIRKFIKYGGVIWKIII